MVSDIEKDEKKKAFFRQLTNADFFIVGIAFKLSGIENCLQLSNGLDCNVMKMESTPIDLKNRKVKIE